MTISATVSYHNLPAWSIHPKVYAEASDRLPLIWNEDALRFASKCWRVSGAIGNLQCPSILMANLVLF